MYHASKSTWYNPAVEYIFNREIIEYDMKDAGISIIQHFKLLDEDVISELLTMEKTERHINIGKLRGKDRELSKILNDKFSEMRSIFISENNLTDDKIICVKNDAIYTIGSQSRLQFGKVEFIKKNIYSSYVRFVDNMNIEVFYGRSMDIKGIGEVNLDKHRLYMLMFIGKIVSYLEGKNASLKRYLRSFVDQYKQKELDDGYYIEFNNMSSIINPMYNYQKVLIPLIQISLKEVP